MSDQSIAKKIIKGMVVVLFFWAFWKFGGFLMNIIIGNLFPPGPEADAYAHVYKYIVFTFIYSASLKVLVPAFMPIFIEKFGEDGEEEAWRFASTILNIVLTISIVGSVLAIIFAPQIISLLVPGFDPQAQALGTRMLRIMLPGSVGMVLSMVLMGMLNSYKIFGYPAAADAAQKLIWAVVLAAGVKLIGAEAEVIAYGFLAGCVAQVVISSFGLRSKASLYVPSFVAPRFGQFIKELAVLGAFAAMFLVALWLAHDGIAGEHGTEWRVIVFTFGLFLVCVYSAIMWLRVRKKMTAAAKLVALSAPLLIGVAFAIYRDVITSLYQSYTQTGVFAGVEYAKNIGNTPIVLVAFGLSIAMFPYLCEMASGKDMKAFGEIVSRALRLIAIFFIPLSIIIILLNRPIVALVYDRGNWTNHTITYAGIVLALYVTALFFYAIESVIMRAFFSIQMMWTPTLLGIITALIQVAFLYFGISFLGFDHPHHIFFAVSVAYPFTRIIKNTVLLAVLKKHVPILPVRETFVFSAKLATVCLAFGMAVHFSYKAVDNVLPIRQYKNMSITVDTFDDENRDWVSSEADDFSVTRLVSSGPDLRRSAALVAHYKPLPRGTVSLERELDNYRLNDVSHVSFSTRSTYDHNIEVKMLFVNGEWVSNPIAIGKEWRSVSLDVPTGKGRAIEIAIRIPPAPKEDQRLMLNDLRFVSEGTEHIIDHFVQPTDHWAFSAPDGPILLADAAPTLRAELIGDTGEERRASPALAIRPGITARRDIQSYDLTRMTAMRLRAVSQSGGQLVVELLDSDGNRATVTEVLEPEGQRATRTIPFSDFSSVEVSKLKEASFQFIPAESAQDGEALMLDSLGFTPQHGRFMGIDPVYEAVKIVNLAVPTLVGGIIFITLLFLLKIEEGRLTLDWVLAQGRAKLGKFRK